MTFPNGDWSDELLQDMIREGRAGFARMSFTMSGDSTTYGPGFQPDFVSEFVRFSFVPPPAQAKPKGCPHAFLGVPCNASGEEITKAYRQAAMKTHPDRGPSEEAEVRGKKMGRLNSAYEAALKGLS